MAEPSQFMRAWRQWKADQEGRMPEEDGLRHPDLAFAGGWTAHAAVSAPRFEMLVRAIEEMREDIAREAEEGDRG